jgi:tetratricopeptide (TPR) repeat protein
MRIIAILLLTFSLAVPLAAQTTPSTPAQSEELDKLFGQLRNKSAPAEAFSSEARIWDLWMRAGSEKENEILQTASAAMGSGNFSLSETMLNQLISTTKSYPEAFNKRATLYFLMGRYDESLADIVSTLELEPRHFGALAGRGMIYQKLGKNREALKAYSDALVVNPNLPGAAFAIKELEKLLPEL